MLHLANGDTLNRKLQAPDNVVARQCSADKAPGKIVDEVGIELAVRVHEGVKAGDRPAALGDNRDVARPGSSEGRQGPAQLFLDGDGWPLGAASAS